MKKTIASILAAFAALLAAAAPEVTWLSTVHNFGAFDEDSGPAVCEFRFVNTGDEPLTVISARASCGCTQPTYPREAVAPGDTAVVYVSYNPAGRPGRFSKTVRIETNASVRDSKLTVKGVVIGSRESVAGRYPVDKGSLKLRNQSVIFGKVTRPHIKTVFAEAYNRTADSLRMSVVSKPRCIDINFEPAVVPPGEQLSIICYFRSNEAGLYGFIEDSVRLAAGSEQFNLPFSAVVHEDFSKLKPADMAKAPVAAVEHESLDFGRMKRSDGPVTLTLPLGNEGKNTLEVRRVYSVDSGVSASVDRSSVKKGKKAEISVTVDPSALPGDILNARVSVITNDPVNPVLTLRAVGIVD